MSIKAVAMDVDGVLTDGTVWLDSDGREQKRISFADIMGLSLGRQAGLTFAFITGESGPTLDQLAAKLNVTEIYAGCRDKAQALREFASTHGLDPTEVCFIGDDVNDLPAFALCGLAIAPANSHPAALAKATLVTERPGGGGAVREIIDSLLGQPGSAPLPNIGT